ncbi:LuxR C-terminal-related transcriptional regulator [Phytoactinopolyspora limicola]|uniref:LuxR C-terminal-related transcriptional regulator n=1 Tax=Phytoactinopolyspora limicola TaxID=2715536 RepID=UPI001408793A|nr:LuxR C-terminal-related transcriptional regulator [Phytoactinopolyspora limicola]
MGTGGSGGPPAPNRLARTSLERRRLVELILGASAAPLTVIQGPAGIGKSVLLEQVARRAWRVRVVQPGPDDHLPTYLGRSADLDGAMTLTLIDRPGPLSELDGAAVVEASRRSPTTFVVATRTPLDVVTGGMQLDGGARIISIDDLLFTPDEVTALATRYRIELTPQDAADVHLATDGWPAMVDAALRSHRVGKPVLQRHLQDLISRFIREEVLATVPDNERAMLIVAAALPQFDAPVLATVLAEQLPESDLAARQTIERWASSGWVVPAASTGYWRMPKPLRQNLLTELNSKHPDQRVSLVDRAVRALVEQDRTSETLPYLVEASERVVSELLRAPGRIQLGSGHYGDLMSSVNQLADDDLASHPALLLIAAVEALRQPPDVATFMLRLDQADAKVDRSSLNASLLSLHSMRILAARIDGDLERAREIEHAGQAYIDAATDEQRREYVTRLAYFNHQRGTTRLAEGDLPAADAALRVARTQAHTNGADWHLANITTLLGYTAFLRGEVDAAAELADSTVALLQSRGWLDRQFTDHLYLTQALLEIEHGRGHAATTLLHTAQSRLEADAEPPAARLALAWSTLGILLDDPTMGERAFLLCGPDYRTNQLPLNRFFTAISRAQVRLVHGEPKAALAELDDVTPPPGHAAQLALTRHRVYLALADVDHAADELAGVHDLADVPLTVRADLHAAATECALRRNHDPRAPFGRLLAILERTGARRPVLLSPWLRDALVSGDLAVPESSPAAGLGVEVEALRSANLNGVPTLSEREAQILAALAGPDTLANIARNLYISPNTLKTTTRAIYRKVGASDRHLAVKIARAIGLLPVSAPS